MRFAKRPSPCEPHHDNDGTAILLMPPMASRTRKHTLLLCPYSCAFDTAGTASPCCAIGLRRLENTEPTHTKPDCGTKTGKAPCQPQAEIFHLQNSSTAERLAEVRT